MHQFRRFAPVVISVSRPAVVDPGVDAGEEVQGDSGELFPGESSVDDGVPRQSDCDRAGLVLH